jgi:hypothetical protein
MEYNASEPVLLEIDYSNIIFSSRSKGVVDLNCPEEGLTTYHNHRSIT